MCDLFKVSLQIGVCVRARACYDIKWETSNQLKCTRLQNTEEKRRIGLTKCFYLQYTIKSSCRGKSYKVQWNPLTYKHMCKGLLSCSRRMKCCGPWRSRALSGKTKRNLTQAKSSPVTSLAFVFYVAVSVLPKRLRTVFTITQDGRDLWHDKTHTGHKR